MTRLSANEQRPKDGYATSPFDDYLHDASRMSDHELNARSVQLLPAHRRPSPYQASPLGRCGYDPASRYTQRIA